jgi:hypothetical protein
MRRTMIQFRVKCPYCLARPLHPCVTRSGNALKYADVHVLRMNKATNDPRRANQT